MDQASSNRRSARKPVLLSAQIEANGVRIPVRLRNLSEQGALIEGVGLPGVGTVTRFERGELRVAATIAWASGGLAGINFERTLDASEVLRHIPVPRARPEVDHRRPGFRPRRLTAEEQRLVDIGAVAPRACD